MSDFRPSHPRRPGSDLTVGSLARHLVRLTIPSIGGGLAIMIFNLTDAFFVSRLGTEALAAMGFTFPVVMIIGSVAMGLGLGASSVIARAVGANDWQLARRTATDGIILAMLATAVISVFGYLTIEPLFRRMGAAGEILAMVRQYMAIWYFGAVAAIVPPVGDGCMRATGEMVRPLIVMSTCAVGNMILDPILIFGYLGFPAMGIQGAALATVLSRCIGMCTNLWFVHHHCHLIDFHKHTLRAMLDSWKRIAVVGVPAALVRVLVPVSRAVFVSLAMGAGGVVAVAAFAAGGRIESFALAFQMAFSIALLPTVGQNWGASRFDRVVHTRRLLIRFSFILGGVTLLFFLVTARHFGAIFSDDPNLIAKTAHYLVIVALGHAGMHLVVWTSQSLNAVGKALPAAVLNIVQVAVFLVPLACLGRFLAGFRGMLWGITVGQLLAGGLAILVGHYLLGQHPEVSAANQSRAM